MEKKSLLRKAFLMDKGAGNKALKLPTLYEIDSFWRNKKLQSHNKLTSNISKTILLKKVTLKE